MKKLILVLVSVVGLFAQGSGVQTAVISAPGPSPVVNQFVSNVGTTGGTTYCYFVVAVYNTGMSQPNGGVCTQTSNGTLTGGNYNTITWTAPNSAVTGYWVVRSTGGGFPGTGTVAVNNSVLSSSTLTLNDQSNSLNSFTYSPANYTNAEFYIDNFSGTTPNVYVRGIQGTTIGFFGVNGVNTIDTTGAVPGVTYALTGSATIAQVNSGTTILSAVTGRRLRVVGFELQAIGGAFGTCTAVQITDTAGTPIVSFSVPIATLTQNTIVTPASSNITFTTYAWQGQLTASKGLQVNKTGGTCDTATSLNYRISYTINN